MEFEQAEKRFKQLKNQFESGTLSEPEFKTQLEELMVQDEQGTWWMIGYETERWYRHDGTNWVQVDRPGSLFQESTPVTHTKPETRVSKSAEEAIREKEEREAAEKVVREKDEITAHFKEEQNKLLQEKADLEKRLREEQERSKRISQESAKQEPILEVRQPVTQKSEEQQLMKESEKKESILVEDTQKVSIWKFGKQEVIRGIIGAILYLVISGINRSISWDFGLDIDLPTPFIVFFGIAYGPWVGLITGLFGSFLRFIFVGY